MVDGSLQEQLGLTLGSHRVECLDLVLGKNRRGSAPAPHLRAWRACADDQNADDQHHRQQEQTRVSSACTGHALQEEGHEHGRREQGTGGKKQARARDVKDRIAEEPQRQHGLGRPLLLQYEGAEQDQPGDSQAEDLWRTPGVQLTTPHGDQQERHDRRHQQRRAQVVDRAPHRLDRQIEDGADDEQRDHPDGQVDVEDPAPGEVVDEESAE